MPHFPKPFFKQSRSSWYVEIDRKQVKLGPDRDAAFRRYHELMRRPRSTPVVSESVASLADAFLEWAKQHRAGDTYAWYQYRIQRFCQRYPDLRTTELRPYHVQEWVDSYSGLTQGSKRNYVRSVKRCIRWAQQQGYLDNNPIQHLELPKANRKETVVTVEEFESLLAQIGDQDFRDLVVTTWESGCRPQESLRVEARHVDLKHQRWVFPASESKGEQRLRVVYLTQTAMEITQDRMQRHPSGALFRNSTGAAWTPDAVNCAFNRVRTRLFQKTIPDAKTLIKVSVDRWLKQLLVRVGEHDICSDASIRKLPATARRKALAELVKLHVPAYSLYALRHAWATRALQQNVDPLTVAILMGHADPSTLSRVYQHVALNPAHMLEQAKRAAGAGL